MAGQSFATDTRHPKISLATGHAGNRSGSGATDGAAGGASGSLVESIDIACTDAATVKNTLRIFRNENGIMSFLKSIPIPEIIFVNGQTPDFSMRIPINEELSGTTSKLAYDMEASMGLDITENIVDW